MTTFIDYAALDNTTPSTGKAYIVDKPKNVWVKQGTTTLEEKWFAYDNQTIGTITKGNVTTVSSWLDQVSDTRLPVGSACPLPPHGSGGTCVTTQTSYDGRGNLTTVVDANGNLTTTTYDTATQIFPSKVKNALNQSVATAYDPSCGKLLWQTITYPDGPTPPATRSENTYDTFCRLQTSSSPYPGVSGNIVTRSYGYFLGAPWQGASRPNPPRCCRASWSPATRRSRLPGFGPTAARSSTPWAGSSRHNVTPWWTAPIPWSRSSPPASTRVAT